ncbi:MAG TPA: phenylalanine--tRNA ligase subunit alpha [Pyrinomonadaceae bacterium]|jgi:phenylalanyl-tRNA synthetase alpha chain|nr:phenylalanine--tRNA ligase subunit alpha [Pyrinomonadaceae bacterium]
MERSEQDIFPDEITERIRNAFDAEMVKFRSQPTSLNEAERDLEELKTLNSRYLGKKSELAFQKKLVGKLEPVFRREYAIFLQGLESYIRESIEIVALRRRTFVLRARTARESIDVTIPGRRPRPGHLHPITLMRQRIEDIFVSMGYIVEDDREIETDFYNFDALNIPEGHPARDSQDTFYTTEGFALRSQTSTVQIHAMQRRGAPVRMIAPGRVFRRDTPDPTHNPMFFQVEGLCVDRGITMAHLKGTLAEFVHRLFGPETQTRFRPSYFPFTEPSAEVDYSCFNCSGQGCRICKQSGWIELGGSGMVHPNVLRAANVDPEEFTGFAFGLGIDRTCARIYQLDDIRLLFENDVRFLEQFR